MEIETIYEDDSILVINKPAGIVVFPEGQTTENTLIDALIEKFPELKSAGDQPRYGIVHRLDKDTSGVLFVAKTNESLIFLQKQFINRGVEKKYVCLVEGIIKEDKGEIKTLIGRSPKDKRKQKAYPLGYTEPGGKREAITHYEVIARYESPTSPPPSHKASDGQRRLRGVNKVYYTLLKVKIKTGRRHQIRCHFSYLQHPIAGDKLYGFKNSKIPKGLTRQFLHAVYLKIQLPSGEVKEFKSELPEELQNILDNLNPVD